LTRIVCNVSLIQRKILVRNLFDKRKKIRLLIVKKSSIYLQLLLNKLINE
jgi:hypothetical protein